MTPRQAPSSQPLQCANEAAAAAAASSSSSSRYSSSATFKGCFFLQLSISLLALAAGVAACDGESYTGNWCAAVPVAVNVQNEGHYVPAVPAVCPEHASIACGDIGHSDWYVTRFITHKVVLILFPGAVLPDILVASPQPMLLAAVLMVPPAVRPTNQSKKWLQLPPLLLLPVLPSSSTTT